MDANVVVQIILVIVVGIITREYLNLRQKVQQMESQILPDLNTSTGAVAAILGQGSSAWCTGNTHTSRTCRFKNICYFPEKQSFVFLHGENSVLSGLPEDRFKPALLDMSSVRDHNTQYFNFVDLPAKVMENLEVKVIDRPSLIFRRFHPNNLMHILHDDLLPAYTTLGKITGGQIGAQGFDIQLVLMEGWEAGPYIHLYQLLSLYPPILASQFNNTSKPVCFKDAFIGISKDTTWYQYGFDTPQGPLPNTKVTSVDIRRFTAYYRKRLEVSSSNGSNQDYIVLFTRKQNRLILNEMDLTLAIVDTFKVKVMTVSMETHSFKEIVEIISHAAALIGMHGSLMALAMFLPAGSAVVELFPYAVRPERYTPYRTLAGLQGMRLVYRAWRNELEANTVAHPTRPWDSGGISHLSTEEQEKIKTSDEVPVHLCCRDPEWLYRIYQDTIVDLPTFLSVLEEALEETESAKKSTTENSTSPTLFPTYVNNITCVSSKRNTSTNHQPFLWLTWKPPWNLPYLDYESLTYEVWIQEEGEEDYTAYLLKKTNHKFTDSIQAGMTYNIWVRCIVDDVITGPMNRNLVSCSAG